MGDRRLYTWLGDIQYNHLKVGQRVISGHTFTLGTIADLGSWYQYSLSRRGFITIKWDNNRESFFWYYDDEYDIPLIYVINKD